MQSLTFKKKDKNEYNREKNGIKIGCDKTYKLKEQTKYFERFSLYMLNI